jgi:[histone H3]-N6,N6-dimethyl-lysine9 N-methyltransferase
MFVQVVFADTHDLRFPWISLFAKRNICAGEELTWDYEYEAGKLEGKILICQCGETNCRGRLL